MESVRDRLLASGAQLIADKGFGGVSVREICCRAGTSANMIHHYFGNKQGLLDAIVDQFGSGVFALPSMILSGKARSKNDFICRMELLFESTLEAYIQHRSLLLVVLREQANPEELHVFMALLKEFLDQSKQQGFVREQVDTEMMTGFLLDRIFTQVQLAPWIKSSSGHDVLADLDYRKRWSKANLDIFLNGVAQTR